ncbi:TPA: hypothetical protein DE059_01395 [Candidatus Peribacteria bacterium]|jgi:hypothetical protein|nr:hypothetical protein [Candidatus Peribacteria bacterium]|tara:strand:- start:16556 stop:16948 length:393 start_codon:yes stop_codon:yes gene_type:complete
MHPIARPIFLVVFPMIAGVLEILIIVFYPGPEFLAWIGIVGASIVTSLAVELKWDGLLRVIARGLIGGTCFTVAIMLMAAHTSIFHGFVWPPRFGKLTYQINLFTLAFALFVVCYIALRLFDRWLQLKRR